MPVVVAGAEASSFTVRLDENIALSGKEVSEVADRAALKKKLPEAIRGRLEAAGFKVVGAGDSADLVLSVQARDVEWTGRFWDARGNVAAALTPPAPPDQADAGAPAPEPAIVARASAKFEGLDFPVIADAVATSIADQLARSNELSQWLKAKRAKEEAAKAPPPPVEAPPPPPPAKGLEESEIKPVLVGLRAAYRGCYDAVLVNNPGLTGTLSLKVAIQPSGAVDAVATDGSQALTDAGLGGCIADVTKTARFPKAEGPSSITYPLEFAADPAPEVNKGGLDAAEIQKEIRGAHDKMRSCFEAGLKKDAAFAGSMKLKFAIDLKGHVPKVEAAKGSSLKDPDVEKCIFEVVKGITFPKPKRWTEVTYPIELKAR
jgi:hypothetical protein